MTWKGLWLASALAVPALGLGLLAVSAASKSGGHALAATTAPAASEKPTPPDATYVSRKAPETRRAFFGDLHLHTAMSFDAWSFGTKVTPDQAYKFARGEAVMVPASQVAREEGFTPNGMVAAKRRWPLDFMAVTDHSEFMGVMNQLDDPANPLSKSPLGQKILADPHQAFVAVAQSLGDRSGAGSASDDFHGDQAMLNTWGLQIKAANDNYQPGRFTTFVAYEWTSAPDGKNLHRNVIFNADHAPPPFTATQSKRPEDLWTFLEKVRANG
ncbi:DUF3604 domain-containing protein, partial [Phenylobacterium sp.]|uniref:DUF3604 domain-containing protein n=1 Tax=Phenylobacterium sp. TaxID=1871053 RepID=UPI0025F64B4C